MSEQSRIDRGLTSSPMSRRTLLKWSGAAGMMAVAGHVTSCVPTTVPGEEGSDANGLVLPPGFTSRVIAQGGQRIPGTTHTFSIFPDGAATFADLAVPGGWFLAVNHEIPFENGGVSSIRFAPDGTIVDAYPICNQTSLNCAGGRTPWGTWLSGEEFEQGRIWECDPARPRSGVPRSELGHFPHEAAAVALDGRVYLTEDRPNGGFYRFTPTRPGDLSAGLLEIATGPSHNGTDHTGTVTWVRVPDPYGSYTSCRVQLRRTLHFDGGEGIDTQGTKVWFTTKGDDRIWEYDTDTAALHIRYEGGGASMLSGVDNLLVDRNGAADGTLLIAEDGDNLQIVLIRADNTLAEVVRVVGQDGSEITGPTFSPDGQRLYFSSQRGPVGPGPKGFIGGLTYEVTGPFDELLGR